MQNQLRLYIKSQLRRKTMRRSYTSVLYGFSKCIKAEFWYQFGIIAKENRIFMRFLMHKGDQWEMINTVFNAFIRSIFRINKPFCYFAIYRFTGFQYQFGITSALYFMPFICTNLSTHYLFDIAQWVHHQVVTIARLAVPKKTIKPYAMIELYSSCVHLFLSKGVYMSLMSARQKCGQAFQKLLQY